VKSAIVECLVVVVVVVVVVVADVDEDVVVLKICYSPYLVENLFTYRTFILLAAGLVCCYRLFVLLLAVEFPI